jgi:hypothetical protein
MRKSLLLTGLLFCIAILYVQAQTTVVNTPQHRNVVLEEYTGIHCGYCPDGHVRAEFLRSSFPERVVLVNIHAGSFAVPSSGEPDFRTIYGEALASGMGVTGYPSGTVNRHIFPEIGSTYALSRSAWYYSAMQIMPEKSPVNVGYTSNFNYSTRELNVEVSLYFTEAIPSCQLHVALLENHVFGYQADYTNGTQTNYDHKHILRDLLTGQWGTAVTPAGQGTTYTTSFSTIVSNDFNIDNCDLAVYVTENNYEVYTGVRSYAVGGVHTGETSLYIGTVESPLTDVDHGVTSQPSEFTFGFESALAGTEEFEFTLTSDAPTGWTGSFLINGVEYTGQTLYSVNQTAPEQITIKVVPGSTPAFATYTLEIRSTTYPNADIRKQMVYVMNGITDLIITSTGSWGDGEMYDFDQDFIDGMNYAQNQAFAMVNADLMVKSGNAGFLNEVNNIYFHIGWRFPSINEDQAAALMQFLDNGGNLFISGQDIAWDIMSGDGYGGNNAKNLFSNYLNASYQNDGGTSNTQLTPVPEDAIFGNMNSSAITDIFSGNFYPDQILAMNGALPVFRYNNLTAKTGGIRFDNGTFKTVYLCIDLAMVADPDVRKEILKRTHDWFYATVSVESPVATGGVTIYPNPANEQLTISGLGQDGSGTRLELTDLMGRVVMENETQSATEVTLNVKHLPAGTYILRLAGKNGNSTQKFEIIR